MQGRNGNAHECGREAAELLNGNGNNGITSQRSGRVPERRAPVAMATSLGLTTLALLDSTDHV